MKMKFLLLAVALGVQSLCACDDDYKPEAALQNAFEEKYPAATRVSWDTHGIYYVAKFHINRQEMEAWFDQSGQWFMTETNLTFGQLPEKVAQAFRASRYAAWRVDDVDKVERPDQEIVYVIEVEQGEQDLDLHYTAEGILLKAEASDGDTFPADHLTNTLPASVKEFIEKNYPGARIAEYETDKGFLEVDFIDTDNRANEAVFNAQNAWVYTTYEVLTGEVPEIVITALRSSQYKDWRIDDIDCYETATPKTPSYYRFELESGNREVKINIDTAGKLVP